MEPDAYHALASDAPGLPYFQTVPVPVDHGLTIQLAGFTLDRLGPKIVAVAHVFWAHEERPVLGNVWVDPAFRRRGHGRRLVELAKIWGRTAGKPLFLSAFKDWRLDWYGRLGFEETGETLEDGAVWMAWAPPGYEWPKAEGAEENESTTSATGDQESP